MWNDSPQVNRNFAWENFMNGHQVLFMDPYIVYYPRQNRNLPTSPVNGIGSRPDPRWDNFRNNLGYILNYSRRLDLAKIQPRSSLSSTNFCLANTSGEEFLIYAPEGGSFTVRLPLNSSSGKLAVEWFDPSTGKTLHQDPIATGASAYKFTSPFKEDAVLYLKNTIR